MWTENQTSINYRGHEVSLSIEVAGIVALPDLSDRDSFLTADESHENGCYGVKQWNLSETVRLYVDTDDGYPVAATVTTDDIDDYVMRWDHDGEPAEWLAGWGFDALARLVEAAEGYNGDCRIWCEPCYYHGASGALKPGFVRDDQGEIMEFGSYAEADQYVQDYYGAPSSYNGILACNVLSHGQAGADDLTIVTA